MTAVNDLLTLQSYITSEKSCRAKTRPSTDIFGSDGMEWMDGWTGGVCVFHPSYGAFTSCIPLN